MRSGARIPKVGVSVKYRGGPTQTHVYSSPPNMTTLLGSLLTLLLRQSKKKFLEQNGHGSSLFIGIVVNELSSIFRSFLFIVEVPGKGTETVTNAT